MSYGAPCQPEIELAEEVVAAYPGIEQVRFVSSGTEAVMSAVRLARGATGRDLVVKFSGCYHGHVDYLLVAAGSGLATFGQPSSQGVPSELAALTRVLPLDDTEAAEKLFAAEGDRIAAVIIEPVPANNGLLLQRPEFLKTLRALCTKHGALLIFDEVISGFRLGPGGAAAHYAIKPDLATFGKVIGGGMPVGGFAGLAQAHETLVARRRRLSGRHAVGQSRRDDGGPDDAARAAEGRRLEAARSARRVSRANADERARRSAAAGQARPLGLDVLDRVEREGSAALGRGARRECREGTTQACSTRCSIKASRSRRRRSRLRSCRWRTRAATSTDWPKGCAPRSSRSRPSPELSTRSCSP